MRKIDERVRDKCGGGGEQGLPGIPQQDDAGEDDEHHAERQVEMRERYIRRRANGESHRHGAGGRKQHGGALRQAELADETRRMSSFGARDLPGQNCHRARRQDGGSEQQAGSVSHVSVPEFRGSVVPRIWVPWFWLRGSRPSL